MSYLGDFALGAQIRIPFTTHDTSGGRVDPSSIFEDADIRIYKNENLTENSPIALDDLTTTFDGLVGLHLAIIDTADDTDTGFFARGNDYFVVHYPDETIDGESVVRVLATFSIENRFVSDRSVLREAIVSVVTSQTVFQITGASQVNNSYLNCPIIIENAGDTRNLAVGIITAYSGGTQQVTLLEDPGLFTITAQDRVWILADVSMKTATNNRYPVVSAGGQTETDLTHIHGAALTETAGQLAAAFVQFFDVASPTGTINSLPALDVKLDRNMDLAQHMRGFHTHQGNIFYVAPANGNDSSGDGSRALPYATLQNAIIDLITSGNHDTIILLADDAPGVTTHSTSAPIICNKRYFSILGPGRDLIITNDATGVNTFEITADGIEISGFQIGTHNQGAGDGVNITAADFHRIHHCWFLDTQGDGIHCERGSRCQFHDNNFEGTGVTGAGQGIHITGAGGAGNANKNVIQSNHFAATDGTAILIDGGTTDDTSIHHNTIHNSGAGGAGWGIDITASSHDAQVHSNILGNSADGDIRSADATAIIRNNRGWMSPTVETTAANVSRTLDVTETGAGGIDWGNMQNKGATVALTSTSIGLTEVARSSITGGEYPISTNDGGFVRIADGTATGEINTSNGAIALVDVTTTVTDDVTTDAASRTASKATSVTVSDKTGFSLSTAGLALFMTVDTSEITAVAGSVAKIAQGSGGDATEAKQDAIIDTLGVAGAGLTAAIGADSDTHKTLSDQIDGIVGGTGTGARTVAVTVNDGAAVLENASVRFTEGANTYAGPTDASGEISFSLDDATYAVAVSKPGYTFTPTTLVVDGDKTPTYSMTAVSITAPPNAATTTGVMTVYDEEGSVESGVTITVQVIDGPGTAGIGYDSTEWAATSNGSGVVEFAGIILGARYKIWRGTSKPEAQTFTAPTTGTSFDLAEVIGRG